MPILIVGHALSTSPFTMIHSIPFIQFTCLTVFLFVLDPLFHTPCISSPNHIFSFRSTCPYHRSLFCCNTNASIPNLSLSAPYLEICQLNATHPPDHSHLCSLSATSFSFLTGQVPLPCNMLLRTQLLYNLPVIINDTSLLVSSGTNCLNWFQPILILASTAASTSPSTLSMSPR